MNKRLVKFEFDKSPLHTIVYGATGTGKTCFVKQYLKLYLDQNKDQNQNQNQDGEAWSETHQNQNKDQKQNQSQNQDQKSMMGKKAKANGRATVKLLRR